MQTIASGSRTDGRRAMPPLARGHSLGDEQQIERVLQVVLADREVAVPDVERRTRLADPLAHEARQARERLLHHDVRQEPPELERIESEDPLDLLAARALVLEHPARSVHA